MLAPINSLLCPISFQIATNPVYLKDCFHAFDRDSITNWIQKQMTGGNNIVDCPCCRCEYALIVPEDQDRNVAIDALCRDIIAPLVVPAEVNKIVELMLPHIQDDEPTIEGVASAVQELIAAHLRIIKENTALSAEVQKLSYENALLNATILRERREHKEEITKLNAEHRKEMTELMQNHKAQMTWSCFFAGLAGATVGAAAIFGPLRGMVRPLVGIAAPIASTTLETTFNSTTRLSPWA